MYIYIMDILRIYIHYVYIYMYIYICIYIYIYIYTNLPVSAIVRIPHPRSGDSYGQETFLAPSADRQTCNHDTRYSIISIYIYIYITIY